ncbi:MAG: hypothetical protein QHH01_00685 [Spirochaetales bacterium]|nr:hypothetical protein [Spirochaetales bacterium]
MKLLVIMRPSEYEIMYQENGLRYARMIGIFLGAGFDAAFRYARSMEDLDSALVETEPDMVLCGIDHLPRSIGPELSPQDESAAVNVHEYFEECAIPYIGQTPDVIELALSKAALKRRWQAAGVNTPSFAVVEAGQDQPHNLDTLTDYPYLLKPENLGNSKLISESSIAYSAEDVRRIMASLRHEYNGAVLIEHYLGDCPDVQEITCAMIECDGAMVCMPMRLGFAVPKQHHLITAEDKDSHRTVIAPLDWDLREQAVSFAAEAFRAAGVRDYARGDFLLACGSFHAIEINGQPMIPDRWFEGCARFSGLGEAQYLVGIVGAGWERLTREGRLHEPLPDGAKALLAPLKRLSGSMRDAQRSL